MKKNSEKIFQGGRYEMLCDVILIDLVKLMLLAFAVAVWSIFVSKALMTKPIRDKADRKIPYAGYALKCTFCMAGWSALVSVVFYTPDTFKAAFNSSVWAADFLVGWLVLWGMATYLYTKTWPAIEKYAPKMRIKLSKR
jgi:hypothetical protein